ncbi:ParB/RepB/Spo0J family partition protein [Deinococcus metallilatus]|uniref:ParB family chromosome partitioning protein n=1 Tax=Deinococcus metallilatus TaxID=1211322 RepID=A0AAJ5F452_9DEIO|nr:ParB/RepB/Spo0J family partition protein [Deinococcus metallilatus]MBB5294445.1 ParB family chromosome partitioning protein [Deinococcus metallilatus]QBY10190.1 ParB/RepB/Spo0J family partition protein [Deinococcus metallilatus]RXJ13916.1 ParB/RepB/Spo0J family partition protein [Deinococcus metallilatus]TLK29882.1 ParB/RepB/Spo0J family partition protein [Deinococcus metallilatus]GMA15661.1 putative chromosome 1-partitioning protein ParB [Deinococcus metallilatus]
MSKKSSLGRGLDALLSRPQAADAPAGTAVQNVRVDRIVQAAYQPRQVFEPEALAELAQSIREKGVLQPLLVRPRGENFEIVAGERRWRASQLAGLSEVPALIRDLGDREALEIAIIENLQREDLGPLEEARAYQALLDQGLNQEGVAQAVGKGRSTISNALRLLSLPDTALRALESGEISAGHARAILAQPEGDRAWALGEIRTRRLSVREAEALNRGARAPAPIAVNPPRPYRQVELDLSRRTGTRVRITGEDKGRVELNYASREELDRILDLLGYAAEE